MKKSGHYSMLGQLSCFGTQSLLVLLIILFSGMNGFAQSGGYIEFDGGDRYMQIPHHPDFSFSTTEEYTISCWVNVNQYVTNARIVSKRNTSGTDKSGYELFGTNSSSNFFALNTPNPAGTNVFSQWGTIAGNTGDWTHLAFVVSRAGGTTTIYQYQNGQIAKQSANNPSSYAVSSTWDVLIGASNYASVGKLNAKMDNLRFYKTALSQAQVQADMTATVTSSTPGLVAAYDFENYSSTAVNDLTGNHTATLVGFGTNTSGITGVSVTQESNFTGRGNDNEVILKAAVSVAQTESLNEVVLDMGSTSAMSDVETIKVYTTGSSNSFDSRNPSNATLVGSLAASSSSLTIPLNGTLNNGTNYLWITCQVSETAVEGNQIDAALQSVKSNNAVYNVSNGNPSGSREILLRRKLLYAPGDAGSSNYRIPAIITAADGSLVTLTDKRKYNAGDLPSDIDIICKRSTDGGVTWSAPIVVAQGTGQGAGFGDAVLIKAQSGKLVALFVGGPGLWSSTPNNPIRSYVSTSTDNGLSWSNPVDITSSIFGAGAPSPRNYWYASFFGSGRGLTLDSGRIMAVAAIRETNANNTLNNYVVYSDDEGQTWQLSNKAISAGDEAKVVQLSNGDVLMSSRGSTRKWAKSTNGGISWGPQGSWSELTGNPTNGDMLRFTSTNDGYVKNRILHTIPYSSVRENVSMFISYDEGGSWPVRKTIDAGASAYSSITILNDNTIGVYVEEDNGAGYYDMYFLNFSLNWLTDGADALSSVPPVANFNVPAAVVGQPVTFTNTSTGATSYSWTFTSANPTNSTAENPAVTYAQAGTYNVTLVASNANGSNSISKQVVVSDNSGNCAGNQLSLTINLDNYPGETTWRINNSSGQAVASGGPYNSNNNPVSVTIPVLASGNYTFVINDSYGDGICCNYGNGSYELKAGNGTTIASGGAFSQSESTDFCIQASSDTQAPTAPTNLSASNTTQTSTSLQWTASTDNVGVTAYRLYRDGNLLTTTSQVNYNVTGLSPATTYSFYVVALDAAGNTSANSNTVSVTTQNAPISYCTASGNSTNYEWIDFVQLTNVSNASGKAGYSNFTAQVANVSYGNNTISYSAGFSGSTYNEYWTIWIDFNKDGTFANNEKIVNRTSNSSGTLSSSFTVPTSAASGQTRMRVAMKYGGYAAACGSFSYGEVEDYTVNIISNSSLQQANDPSVTGLFVDRVTVKLAPNPVSNGQVLHITTIGASDGRYQVFNGSGQLISKGDIEGHHTDLHIQDWPKGVYVVRFLLNEQAVSKKLIVQ